MAKKKKLEWLGKTTDRRDVFDFFDAYDSLGLPLSTILLFAKEHEDILVIGWGRFWTRAQTANWNISKAVKLFYPEIVDVFGVEYAKGWLKRTQEFIAL